jgi:hypothetical protein
VDNIKMDLREIGWDGVDWIDVAQDRDQWRALLNMVMNLRVPLNVVKRLQNWWLLKKSSAPRVSKYSTCCVYLQKFQMKVRCETHNTCQVLRNAENSRKVIWVQFQNKDIYMSDENATKYINLKLPQVFQKMYINSYIRHRVINNMRGEDNFLNYKSMRRKWNNEIFSFTLEFQKYTSTWNVIFWTPKKTCS